MSKSISFSVNGEPTQSGCRPDMTVLEWLRGEALLRGTKEGCAEGDCGACSVLVKRSGDTTYLAANSCIMLMGQLEGASLMTVEGLSACGVDGHAIQQHMAENGSSQCGYCTPGIVTSLAGLLERKAAPTEADIHDAMAGNLCRCTGYRPIVEAALAAAGSDNAFPDVELATPETEIGFDGCLFYTPKSLTDLLSLLQQHPDGTLLAGGTDISLDVAHARARWEKTISTRHVAELTEITEDSDWLTVGGAVTWEQVLPQLQKHWPSFATLVRRFGSTQIRSMGTMAGNLGTASPIGDGAPSLLALNARLVLARSDGEREIALDEFFLDYRQSALKAGEIIKAIKIPLPSDELNFRVYKISKRYDQDISTVCGAFSLRMDGETVTNARIAYGGMAAIPKRCLDAEKALVGQTLGDEAIAAAKEVVRQEFAPMTDMRGSAGYRLTVAANLLDRLLLDLEGQTVEVMGL